MEDLEPLWEQIFSPLGSKFAAHRPDYQVLGKADSMIASLYWLELEMYNGGFIQFFCNWGYDAYLLAIEGLETIGATETKQLLTTAYSIIRRLEDDDRLESLWDIPRYLGESESSALSDIDREYWEDSEGIMQRMLLKFHPGESLSAMSRE